MIIMIMMNRMICFCGIIEQRKTLSFISNWKQRKELLKSYDLIIFGSTKLNLYYRLLSACDNFYKIFCTIHSILLKNRMVCYYYWNYKWMIEDIRLKIKNVYFIRFHTSAYQQLKTNLHFLFVTIDIRCHCCFTVKHR